MAEWHSGGEAVAASLPTAELSVPGFGLGAVVERGEDAGWSRQLFKPCAELWHVVSLATSFVHGDFEAVSLHLLCKRFAAQMAPCVTCKIWDEGVGSVEPLREEVPRRFAPDILT